MRGELEPQPDRGRGNYRDPRSREPFALIKWTDTATDAKYVENTLCGGGTMRFYGDEHS